MESQEGSKKPARSCQERLPKQADPKRRGRKAVGGREEMQKERERFERASRQGPPGGGKEHS